MILRNGHVKAYVSPSFQDGGMWEKRKPYGEMWEQLQILEKFFGTGEH